MNRLTRYWFTFAELDFPNPLNIGCGVTAYNLNDARNLISEYALRRNLSVEEAGYIEDVDISSLDQKHVVQNIDSLLRRGVWFPRQG
jgi:hypothetical protein